MECRRKNEAHKEVNVYYYQTIVHDVVALEKSTTPYGTPEEAINAAKDSLATMYVESWPVDIRIYNGPPDDEQAYLETWSTVWKSDIDQHALKRIEEANRPALQEIIRLAVQSFEYHKEQYGRGLLTPLDFAKAQEGNWLQARYDVESKLQA